MTEPTLVSLDVLGAGDDPAAARAAAQAAPPDPWAEVEGRDASRSVTVRLTPSGRVADVAISDWWREELSPGRLGDAVVDAYRGAVTRSAAAMAARPPADPPRPAYPLVRPIEPGLDHDDWLAEIRRANQRAADELDRARRLLREQAGERVVPGPAGIVRLHTRGGVVTTAEIDVHAALQESPAVVAADALAAFQAIG